MVQEVETAQPTPEEVETLKKDISDFVEWHMKHGPHPASVVALQELTRLLLPHVPLATRSVFTRNLTQPVVPINDIADWHMQDLSASSVSGIEGGTQLERGERVMRCELATFYRLAGRFSLFALPNGAFSATARVGNADSNSLRFLISPCGILPHEVTAGSFAKLEVGQSASQVRVLADGNTSMFAPRAVAQLHAVFYRAAPELRVICELRTTQVRAVCASRRGIASTGDAARLGKVTYLEYDEVVPDAIRSAAQKEVQQALAKQLVSVSEHLEAAERELEIISERIVAAQDRVNAEISKYKDEPPAEQEGTAVESKATESEGEIKAEGEAEEAGKLAEKQHEHAEEKEKEKQQREEIRLWNEQVMQSVALLQQTMEKDRELLAEAEEAANEARKRKETLTSRYEATLQAEADKEFSQRCRALCQRVQGAWQADVPNVFLVRSYGAIVCASSVEQCLSVARSLQSACVTTLSLGRIAAADVGNVNAAGNVYADELVTLHDDTDGLDIQLHSYELEFEVLARELDASGSMTGYLYHLATPLRSQRAARSAELSEIEIPPVPLRLTSLPLDSDSPLENGTPTRGRFVEYRATPSVYHREETDVPGSARKLVRWISERGATRSAAGTIYRLDAPHSAFAPPGDAKTLLANRARIKDAYYNDTVSSGPQSRFESETEWDEAARRKDAVLSGRVDTTLVVGAASRGVLAKDALAAGTANTIYYAPNPFQQPNAADRELKRYLKAQQINLPVDASSFLDEQNDETDAVAENYTIDSPKRRASASPTVVPSTPLPLTSNPIAAAAAQRAAELNEKRRLLAQEQSPQRSPAHASIPSTSSPAPSSPAPSSPAIAPSTVPKSNVEAVSGTVVSSTAASAVQPVQVTVSAGKSKTLPAGVTSEQVEAAGRDGKKEKKRGLKAFFSKKDKKK